MSSFDWDWTDCANKCPIEGKHTNHIRKESNLIYSFPTFSSMSACQDLRPQTSQSLAMDLHISITSVFFFLMLLSLFFCRWYKQNVLFYFFTVTIWNKSLSKSAQLTVVFQESKAEYSKVMELEVPSCAHELKYIVITHRNSWEWFVQTLLKYMQSDFKLKCSIVYR